MANKDISRRKFLKMFGLGTVATAATLTGCKPATDKALEDEYKNQVEPEKGKMTYRTTPTTKDKVSILGYGMMRLPTKPGKDSNGESKEVIDQEQVNKLVDYAMENDIPYFALNFPLNRCKNCSEPIYDSNLECCPKCGSNEIIKLGRITGYLSTTIEHFNHGKQKEFKDRVKHIKH